MKKGMLKRVFALGMATIIACTSVQINTYADAFDTEFETIEDNFAIEDDITEAFELETEVFDDSVFQDESESVEETESLDNEETIDEEDMDLFDADEIILPDGCYMDPEYALAFIRFIYNDSGKGNSQLTDQIIQSSDAYKLLTGQLSENLAEEDRVRIDFLLIIYSQINRHIDDSSKKLDYNRANVQGFMEKKLSGQKDIPEEMLGSLQNQVLNNLTKGLLEIMRDVVGVTTGIDVSDEIIENIKSAQSMWSDIESTAGKIQKFVDTSIAAVNMAFMPLNSELKGRYTYFASYLKCRSMWEPEDLEFQTAMNYNFMVAQENAGLTGWLMNCIPGIDSWHKHRAVLDYWAEMIYRLENKSFCDAITFEYIPEKTAVKGIAFDDLYIGIKRGDIYRACAKVFPENATNQGIQYSSSDESILWVDRNTGETIIYRSGEVQITATSIDGEYEATQTITIYEPYELDVVANGLLSENIQWTLYDNGVLAIEGNGDIADFVSGTKCPWYTYRQDIRCIEVTGSLGHLPNFFAYECNKLISVKLNKELLSIGNSAFEGCSSLTCVEMPDTTVELGNSVFKGCTSLVDVKIPGSIENMGNSVFEKCSSLESVRLPDTLNITGHGVFMGCSSLREVNIPLCMTEIPYNTFKDCASLEYINIPLNIIQCGSKAFYGCTNLKELRIPASTKVYSLTDSLKQYNSFGECRSLKKITIYGNGNIECVGHYSWGNTLISYSPWSDSQVLEEVIIEAGVTQISDYAFRYCKTLEKVVLPTSLQCIGKEAFHGCYGLRSVYLPEGLSIIGDHAFQSCSSLINIKIPNTTTSMGREAFSDCNKLISVELSDLIVNIGYGAFAYCSSLQKINISSNITDIPSEMFLNCISLTEITIPDGVTHISNRAFKGCTSLKVISVPAGASFATGYAIDAFEGCTSIEKVIITGTGTFEGSKTGNNNSRYVPWNESRKVLKEVIVEEGVTGIGKYVFALCDALEKVTLPSTITTLGENTFYDCKALASINLPNSITNMENQTFGGCKALKEVIIPSGMTVIPSYAFRSCSGLEKLSIQNQDTQILLESFKDCTGLKEITMPAGIKYYNKSFEGCNSIEKVVIKGTGLLEGETVRDNVTGLYYYVPWYGSRNSLKEVIIEEGVTGIGNNVFMHCTALEKATLPSTINTLGPKAFYGCKSLVSVHLPDSITNMGEAVFEGCASIKDANIPLGISKIPQNAFSFCSKLEKIIIPDSVIECSMGAFYRCESLAEVTLPVSTKYYISSIRSYDSFGNCGSIKKITFTGNGSIKTELRDDKYYAPWSDSKSSIKEIIIGEGVTDIGKKAFENCSALESISIPITMKEFETDSFEKCSELTTIHYHGSDEMWDNIRNSNVAFSNSQVKRPNTIMVNNKMEPSCKNAGYSGDLYCSVCDQIIAKGETITVPHTIIDDLEVNPTCTAIGLTAGRHCSVCGTVIDKQEEIPAIGHQWSDWKATKEPTTTETGLKERSCSVCKETETEEIPKLEKVVATAITLNATTKKIKNGETVVLTATASPEGADTPAVTWTSSKPKYATVSEDGVVTAVCPGSAVITCTTTDGSNLKATCTITVEPADDVEAFVVRMYQICMDRNPDASGLAYWTEPLRDQNVSGLDLAKGFVYSNEFQKKDMTDDEFIGYMYNAFLGRGADKGGMAYWLGEMAKGKTRDDVFMGFADSNEFEKICNNYGIVKDLGDKEILATGLKLDVTAQKVKNGKTYQLTATVTPSDATNKAVTWTSSKPKIATVSDKGVVTALCPGAAVITCTTADGSNIKATCTITVEPADDIEAFVIRLYSTCLNRNPDATGLKYWADRLRSKKETGRSAAHGFIFSDEFINRKYNDEDFIEQMYKAFFGRSSDKGGKTYWLNEMAKGKNREDVFDGFVVSNEFAKMCEQYGIARD